MSDMKFGKVITTQTYYDGILTNTKEELEVSVMSSRDELLKDIIDSLNVLSTGQTNKLSIEIIIDNKGKYRIIRKWST